MLIQNATLEVPAGINALWNEVFFWLGIEAQLHTGHCMHDHSNLDVRGDHGSRRTGLCYQRQGRSLFPARKVPHRSGCCWLLSYDFCHCKLSFFFSGAPICCVQLPRRLSSRTRTCKTTSTLIEVVSGGDPPILKSEKVTGQRCFWMRKVAELSSKMTSRCCCLTPFL